MLEITLWRDHLSVEHYKASDLAHVRRPHKIAVMLLDAAEPMIIENTVRVRIESHVEGVGLKIVYMERDGYGVPVYWRIFYDIDLHHVPEGLLLPCS